MELHCLEDSCFYMLSGVTSPRVEGEVAITRTPLLLLMFHQTDNMKDEVIVSIKGS